MVNSSICVIWGSRVAHDVSAAKAAVLIAASLIHPVFGGKRIKIGDEPAHQRGWPAYRQATSARVSSNSEGGRCRPRTDRWPAGPTVQQIDRPVHQFLDRQIIGAGQQPFGCGGS